MSKIYTDDELPKTMYEELKALEAMSDDEIDYSDIPPIGDDVIVTPVGQKFAEIRRRNLAKLNQMLREREKEHLGNNSNSL